MTSPWDDLVISGGGRVAVASDELLVHAQLLCRLSFGAKETRACLDSIDAIVDHRTLVASDAPLSAARAEESLDRARLLLGRVELEAERLGRALTVSAELYGVAEHTVEQLGQQLAAAFGYAAGTLFPLFMLYAAPTLSVVAGGLALGAVLAPGGLPATSSGLGTWLRENNRLLTNPATVALIRATVMSSDDFTWGRAGVPAPVVGAMGTRDSS